MRLRKPEGEGYCAVQLAFREAAKPERLGKAVAGQYAKLSLPAHRVLAEFRVEGTKAADGLEAGARLTVEHFKDAKRVDVQGIAKGKGFQGVVKRHGFAGGPDSHGSMQHRAPGSIGASTDPGHTLRGTRMGGRMGGLNSTSQNLEVVSVDAEHNLMVVKGAVPGGPGTLVCITPTTKRRAPSARRLHVEVSEIEGAKTAARKAVKK
jgi:large subunit ribosomal protein L3